LSLQDAGAIGEDVAVVPALHSTKTVRRLEFGPAGFTALTMGVQAEGSWNRSRLASSGRETSSANSWTDASRVRIRARTPTATPVATLINIETPLDAVTDGSFHTDERCIRSAANTNQP
jgi:hypothetical protein